MTPSCAVQGGSALAGRKGHYLGAQMFELIAETSGQAD